jgi:hypothetical protein
MTLKYRKYISHSIQEDFDLNLPKQTSPCVVIIVKHSVTRIVHSILHPQVKQSVRKESGGDTHSYLANKHFTSEEVWFCFIAIHFIVVWHYYICNVKCRFTFKCKQ